MEKVYLVIVENLLSDGLAREVDSVHATRDSAMRRLSQARADQVGEDIQSAYFVEAWDLQ